jgi:hypothetical protein
MFYAALNEHLAVSLRRGLIGIEEFIKASVVGPLPITLFLSPCLPQ